MRRLIVGLVLALFITAPTWGQRIQQWSYTVQPQVVKKFFPANLFHAFPDTGAAVMTSMSSTGAFAEISTFGVTSLAMTTADEIGMLMTVPYDLDHNYNIAWRVWWTSTSADDDGSIVFIVSSEEQGQNTALVATTTAGLADDITLDADSTETQHGVEVTTWDTLSTAAIADYTSEKLIQVSVELDADGDASADEVRFIGLEMAYVSKIFPARADSVFISATTAHGVSQGLVLKRK